MIGPATPRRRAATVCLLRAATAAAVALAIVAGILVPMVNAALPGNSWFGLRAPSGTIKGALARCALGDARATETRASVWSAITGEASLDIVQAGAWITPTGERRYFAAWGRGEPSGVPGSTYEERDLGPADAGLHKYTVQLTAGVWSISIDGRTRLRVPDTFRTWAIRAATVSHETESPADPFGGARRRPVECWGTRVYEGAWVRPTWNVYGYGSSALGAATASGSDWFRVWRP